MTEQSETKKAGRRVWVESEGETEGLRWIVVANSMGHRCGYVSVPEDHPWHGLGYNDPVNPLMDSDDWDNRIDCKLDVHGGVTYAERGTPVEGEDQGWWFGFDCAHAGDARDPSIADPETMKMWSGMPPMSDHEVIRTTEFCEAECEGLARQIVAAPDGYPFPTDEMVEAGAKALYVRWLADGDDQTPWEKTQGSIRDDFMDESRLCLTAGIMAGKKERVSE